MIKTSLIDLSPVGLKYYSFMISLAKCSGSWNVWTSIISVPRETKYGNLQAFKMKTNKNESKTMAKYIACGCKYKLNTSTLLHIIQKWNNETRQCECQSHYTCKKTLVGIVAHVLVRMVSI